jgi:RNA recognition motif-containing protein
MRMMVSALPRNFDKYELQRLFSPFGWVTYCKILIDPITARSTGKGYVTIDDDEQAKRAMAALEGKMLGDYPLHIRELKIKG